VEDVEARRELAELGQGEEAGAGQFDLHLLVSH
jgi:hypothetical protein